VITLIVGLVIVAGLFGSTFYFLICVFVTHSSRHRFDALRPDSPTVCGISPISPLTTPLVLWYTYITSKKGASAPIQEGKRESREIDDDLIETGQKIEAVRFIINRNVEREPKRNNRLKGNLKAEKLQQRSDGDAQAKPEET
jgi:hypothetical protein